MTRQDQTVAGETESSELILGMLRDQAGMYSKLETLAARQRALLTGDDMGPLLAVLADRQKLSAQLTGVGERLAPIRRDWSRHADSMSPEQRGEAENLLSDTRQRLRRVIESDEKDARVLSGRKATVAQALQATHPMGQALTAYREYGGRGEARERVDESC